MSLQSEGTITSEDECLEDVILELMKEKGILSQVKGQIAKFIQDSGRVNSKRFIITERADERILSYIYEYLQWIGMKQTCSVLLSESPVRVNHSSVKKRDSESYRPKLQSLLDQLSPELNSKLLSSRKSEPDKTCTQPPTKRLDELIDPTKNVSFEKSIEDSFLTSTPNIAKADATFIKPLDNTSDSKLLMGFNTPVSLEGFRGQPKKSFVPEKLFQEDPFLLIKTSTDPIKTTDLLMLDPGALSTHDNEIPIPPKVTTSEEQFLQDEEEIEALEDQQEDMKKMEAEVMESSLSTEWSEEELVPSSKENIPEPGVVRSSVNGNEDMDDKNSGVDRSKVYEVSDNFEVDKDSESRNLTSHLKEDEERGLQEKKSVVVLDSLESESNKNDELPVVSTKSSSDNKKLELSTNDKPMSSEKNVRNVEVNKSPKKSETEEPSTSDMLSMDMDDDDTQDVSIPSDDKGMSSCEHVVSIK